MAARLFIRSVLVVFSCAAPLLAASASNAAPITARAVHVEGEASYVAARDAETYKVEINTPFAEGDRVITGADGKLEIEFDTGDLLLMDSGAELVIRALERDEKGTASAVFDLAAGRVKSLVTGLAGKGSRFEIHTRAAISGVAGTEFYVETEEDATSVYNTSEPGGGDVFVQGRDAAGTRVILTPGTGTTVALGLAPVAPFILKPELLKSLGELMFHTGGAGAGGAAAPAAAGGTGLSGTTIAAIGAGGGLAVVAAGSSGGGGGGGEPGDQTPDTGDGSTPSPQPDGQTPDVAGDWAGTWTVVHPQACAGLGGSWTAALNVSGGKLYGYGTANGWSGTATGTWDGNTATWAIGGGGEGITFSGVVTGNTMSGTWGSTEDCAGFGSLSGTFSGSKR
ncbi:MAG: FecR family protein [Candidatus Nitrospinota bacterium M3_3B_026]